MIIRLDENLFLHEYFGARLDLMRIQRRWLLISAAALGVVAVLSFLSDSWWEQALILFAAVLGAGQTFVLFWNTDQELADIIRKHEMGKWLNRHSFYLTPAQFSQTKHELNDYPSNVFVYYRDTDLRDDGPEERRIAVSIPNEEDWTHFRLKHI